MRLVGTLVLCVLCLSLGTTRSAGAQEETIAEALFRAGREDLKREAFAEACPKFRESQRLDPSPGTLLNLAVCEERLGRIATAWAAFRHVLEQVGEADPRGEIARAHLTAIEPNLPRLRLRVKTEQRFEVRLDGVPLGPATLGIPFPIDPGEHQLEVIPEQGEKTTEPLIVAVAEQVEREIVIATPPPPAVKPPPPTSAKPVVPPPRERAPESSILPVVGLAVAGAGVVATGIATYFALGAKSLHEDSNASGRCIGNSCNPDGVSLRHRAMRKADTATALFIAGGVLGGGGLGLFVVTRGGSDSAGEALRARFSVGADGVSITAASSF